MARDMAVVYTTFRSQSGSVYYIVTQHSDGDLVQDLFSQRLGEMGDSLPPTGRRVARYIHANRAAVLASSAMELAAAAGTSDATVIRTVQALGFSGLGALKQALLTTLKQASTPADNMRRTLGSVGENTSRAIDMVFEAHEEALEQLRKPAAREPINAAVAILHRAERIATFGIGPSAALADYVGMLLARSGHRCLGLNMTGAMLADRLLELRSGDALLVMAYGTAYREVVTVFDEARRLDLPIILVTDSLDPKLARMAKVILPARRGRTHEVALHGATIVCLEAVILGLAAADRGKALETLDRLNRLRDAIRGS